MLFEDPFKIKIPWQNYFNVVILSSIKPVDNG
jgi:hypothetical protein